MHNRAARVAPKDGKWEAYFADAPRERCHGETAQEALASLRQYAADREKASFGMRKECAKPRRNRKAGVIAAVVLAVLIATALIVKVTMNATEPQATMYAHHSINGDSE